MKKDENYNPNLEANELIEPMIFFNDNGSPLYSPFVYYDRPLDHTRPLPEIKPLGPEYFTNWKLLEEQTGKILFFDDFGQHLKTLIDKSRPESSKKKEEVINTLPQKDSPPTESTEGNEKAYFVMREFLTKVKVKRINESFFVYSGKAYIEKTDSEIINLIFEKCTDRFKNKSSAFVLDVRNFLKMEPEVYVNPKDLPKHLIAFENGILNIRDRTFHKHSPEFLTLFEIKANYYSCDIDTPLFDKYLQTVSGGDLVLIERILQAIGYIFTPDSNGKCFFLIQGVPDSGKSLFCNLLQKFFNENAFKPLEAHLIGDKFTAAELVGKAFCTFPDMSGAPLDNATVSRIKMFTGNDLISVPERYKKNVQFVCTAKIVSATNHPLLTQKADTAFQKRIVTIPFAYTVENKVEGLEEMLYAERDGIVAKAMAAYFRLVENKYHFAGNFQPNEIISDYCSESMDYKAKLFTFVSKRFHFDEEGIVFIDDAHRLFEETVCNISKNEFSQYFCEYANTLFNGQKSRKRKCNSENALSCVTGISFIMEEKK